MIRCVVVDDEPLAVRLLEDYIGKTDFLSLEGSWTDPVQAVRMIQLTRPDVVFLDIQMPDLDGMELAHMLPEGTRVIFCTAFKEYAFDSYGVDALDFLLKPVRYQKFLEASQKARRWFEMNRSHAGGVEESSDDSIFVKTDSGHIKLKTDDILYIEGMKDYVMVHVASQPQPLVTHLTMKAAESMLAPKNFMRVHRSYIVNTSKIDSVNTDGDICMGTKYIPVSDAYSSALEEFVSRRLLGKGGRG